jgi:hypothetical protein
MSNELLNAIANEMRSLAGQLDAIAPPTTQVAEPGPQPNPQPQPASPGASGDPLATFRYLQSVAPDFVAWRYVMVNAPDSDAVRGALIAMMGGQQQYNNKLQDVYYNQPQATFYHGRAYWIDPTWPGASPIGILAPGYLSVPVSP